MSEFQKLSTIRVTVPDITDGQVWIQSTLSETHKLTRGLRDDFSFDRRALVIITNRGEDFCTLTLECFRAGESGLFIGSNRRGGRALAESDSFTLRMKPGEALTVRSIDAVEPRGAHADGSPIAIRPGQNVVAP
jgi:hypothetical protein